MTFLLDTNALLWAVLAPRSLTAAASAIVSNREHTILISAACGWEIATKVRLGKLPGAEEYEREFIGDVKAAGYTLAPISVEDALRAGRLNAEHRDPFDRMIAAQALAMDIPVISSDAKLDSLGVRRIW